MIQATVLKDSMDSGNASYRGIVIEGHAGYADAGEDIICAGVSAGRTRQAFGLLSKKVLDNIETCLRGMEE